MRGGCSGMHSSRLFSYGYPTGKGTNLRGSFGIATTDDVPCAVGLFGLEGERCGRSHQLLSTDVDSRGCEQQMWLLSLASAILSFHHHHQSTHPHSLPWVIPINELGIDPGTSPADRAVALDPCQQEPVLQTPSVLLSEKIANAES